MSEPNPIRDVGPYLTGEQAGAQYGAQTFGLPQPEEQKNAMVILEACLLAGVETSDFEAAEVTAIAKLMAPTEAVVLAGLIIQANLGGMLRERSRP